MKKKSQLNQKIEAVTLRTLVVGIDIAKEKQWARFVGSRSVECGKAMYFRNDRTGFESILAKIRQISKENLFGDAIVGMEPTGHCWKSLANYLMKQERIHVALANPFFSMLLSYCICGNCANSIFQTRPNTASQRSP